MDDALVRRRLEARESSYIHQKIRSDRPFWVEYEKSSVRFVHIALCEAGFELTQRDVHSVYDEVYIYERVGDYRLMSATIKTGTLIGGFCLLQVGGAS